MNKSKLGSKHLLVLISLCGLIGASMGLNMLTAGLFYDSLMQELGLSKAAVSLSSTILSITTAISGLIVGTLMKKVQPLKALIVLSCTLMIGSTALLSTIHSAGALYFWNAIKGFTGGMVGFVMATMVINHWIYIHHGFITSIVFCFSGIPGAILSRPIAGIIESAGWRHAYISVALMMLAFCLPALLVNFTVNPEDCGCKPYGYEAYQEYLQSAKPQAEKDKGSINQLVLFLVFFYTISSDVLAALQSHVPGYAVSIGATALIGSTMLAMVNVGNIVSKMVYGVVADRYGVKISILMSAVLSTIGMLMMFTIRADLALTIGAFLYGWTMPNSSTGISLLTERCVGPEHYGSVYPIISLAASVSFALFTTVVGSMYDASGSYTGAFFLMFIAEVCVAVGALLAERKNADA